MAKDPIITLKVNGKKFEGFVGGSCTLTMEGPVNAFSLDYVADGKKPAQRSIFEGDKCELLINPGGGEESLIKGYVESVDEEDSKESIILRCQGSSKTVDLVDCSATNTPGTWKKQGLKAIASDIAGKLGITVHIDGSAGKSFDEFSITQGETAMDAIQRAATRRGMYCFTVGEDLVIAKAGSKSSGATLERGKNIVRAGRSSSWKERYSIYTYLGQVGGTDGKSGKDASEISSVAKDKTVSRFRPLVLQVSGDEDSLTQRADVERNQRAGRAETAWVLVDGWGTDKGKVWRPNTTVEVKNPVLGLDATMLIVSAEYTFGPSESRQTMLRLMRSQAFDVADYPVKKPSESVGSISYTPGNVSGL